MQTIKNDKKAMEFFSLQENPKNNKNNDENSLENILIHDQKLMTNILDKRFQFIEKAVELLVI